jgi:hypothetical protein
MTRQHGYDHGARQSTSTPSLDDKEKVMIEEDENAWNNPAGFTEEEAAFMSNFTDAQRAKVLRKVRPMSHHRYHQT